MSDSFEKSLRKAIEVVGHLVEGVIGKARQASVQVSTRGGVQPILSLEGQLTPARIRDLIDISIQKIMGSAIPDLKGGFALEVGEGPAAYGARLAALKPKAAVSVEIGGASIGRQGDSSRGFVLRGQLARLPFADRQFSYLLARLATQMQGDLLRAIRELGRVLAPGGQGVVIDYHPFGLYARHGAHRSRPADSRVTKFEDYYRICRQAGVRVVDVRETFVDEGMRQNFKEAEIQAYRNLKGTPLLIFLFIYKPKGS